MKKCNKLLALAACIALGLPILSLAGCASAPAKGSQASAPATAPKKARASAWAVSPDGIVSRADQVPFVRLLVEKEDGAFDCYMKGTGFIRGNQDDLEYQILNRQGDLLVKNGLKIDKLPVVLDATSPITFKGKRYPDCFLVSGSLTGPISLSALMGAEQFLSAMVVDKSVESLPDGQADAVAILARTSLLAAIKGKKSADAADDNFDEAFSKLIALPASDASPFAKAAARTKGLVLADKSGAPTVPPKSMAADKASALKSMPVAAALAAIKKAPGATGKEVLASLYKDLEVKAAY